jgi:hydrogenase expression/formation protein HypC
MCLGVPGEVIEVHGQTAITNFWGTLKTVSLAGFPDIVMPGDFIISHVGQIVRVIPPRDVADTLGLYEILLCEAGEDPVATDIVDELARSETFVLSPREARI